MDIASVLSSEEDIEHSRKLWTIQYKYFLSRLRNRVKLDTGLDLILDEQIETPLKMFVSWACRNTQAMQSLGMNPRKGILIRGNVGSGKTVLFRTLRDIIKETDGISNSFRSLLFSTAETVAKTYQSGGDKALDDYLKGVINMGYGSKGFRNYVFDDLGNEEAKNHYGNYREVMKDIIDVRYSQYLDESLITCFTTNLTMVEIEKRYDARTRSRIEGMCNIIGIGSSENYIDRRK